MFLTFYLTMASTQLSKIESLINKTRLICYSPSEINPNIGLLPSSASIRQDLATVRPYFSGVVTYGVKDDPHGFIPQIAQELNFHAVILGIWEAKSKDEIQLAIEQTRQYPVIKAICVGNEGLHFNRYSINDLIEAIKIIRESLPDVPITTTETLAQYRKTPVLLQLEELDFHFPTIHPYWELTLPDKNPRRCANWVLKEAKRLQATDPIKRILIIKESGFPSDGDASCSQEIQAEFWLVLSDLIKNQRDISFCFFEAYEPYEQWKSNELVGGHSVESYWAFWTQKREPKKIIEQLPQLPS